LCGEGYLGQNSAYEFFGLGAASEIDYVKVNWLSGVVDLILNPAINMQMTIIEGSTLGVDDHLKTRQLILYPNPSNGVLNVQISEALLGSTMQLIDISGRSLFSSELNSEETELNFNNFSAGVYFVTLQNKGVTYSEKLVLD
jgi:hypothetical protein